MTAIIEEILAGEKRATGTADLMLQMAEWAAAAYARFDRARTLSERTASLFLSIARGSTNREHGTATHRLNMRLHAVRSAEAEVLGDLEHEISSIEMHFARREENALRKGLAAYHRTRQKSAL